MTPFTHFVVLWSFLPNPCAVVVRISWSRLAESSCEMLRCMDVLFRAKRTLQSCVHECRMLKCQKQHPFIFRSATSPNLEPSVSSCEWCIRGVHSANDHRKYSFLPGLLAGMHLSSSLTALNSLKFGFISSPTSHTLAMFPHL
jgi:hypothetical protein